MCYAGALVCEAILHGVLDESPLTINESKIMGEMVGKHRLHLSSHVFLKVRSENGAPVQEKSKGFLGGDNRVAEIVWHRYNKALWICIEEKKENKSEPAEKKDASIFLKKWKKEEKNEPG